MKEDNLIGQNPSVKRDTNVEWNEIIGYPKELGPMRRLEKKPRKEYIKKPKVGPITQIEKKTIKK
jgi:hypothetical protein